MSNSEFNSRQKVIIEQLKNGRMSFGELRKSLEKEMSKQTLSSHLKELVKREKIQRIVSKDRPPKVFYEYRQEESSTSLPNTYGKGYIDRIFIIHLNVLDIEGNTEITKHITRECIDEPIDKLIHTCSLKNFATLDELKARPLSSWNRTVTTTNTTKIDERSYKFEITFDPILQPGDIYTYGFQWLWKRAFAASNPNFYFVYITAPMDVIFWDVTLQPGIKDAKILGYSLEDNKNKFPCEEPNIFKCGDRWKIHWMLFKPPKGSACMLNWKGSI